MLQTAARPARSFQTRPVWPEADETPHPRAIELAGAMLDIAALGAGVAFKDLIRAGFTSAEIIEHNRAAEKIAQGQATRQLAPDADRMSDCFAKVRAPLPNAPLTLPGCDSSPEISQERFMAWGRYCAARSAWLIDPNPGQRERCMMLLGDYLARLPFFPRDRKAILRAAGAALDKASH